MTGPVLLSFLVVALLALLPTWRLKVAGWPPRWLFGAWLTVTVVGFAVLRFPGPARFLLPLLVLAYVAPFVAGPERLTRVLGGTAPPRAGGGVIIDVTPRMRRDAPGDSAPRASGEEEDGEESVGRDA